MTEKFESVFYHHGDRLLTEIRHRIISQPLFYSSERLSEMQRVYNLLIQVCEGYVRDYLSEYSDVIPIKPHELDIVRRYADRPYRVGSIRPDFLLDSQGEMRICEINARFALSGFIYGAFLELERASLLGDDSMVRRSAETGWRILDRLEKEFGGEEGLVILRGSNRELDSPWLRDLLKDLGKPVHYISSDDSAARIELLEKFPILIDFNQTDLERLNDRVIETLIRRPHLNDLRTMLLVHDKRFFTLLSDPGFTRRYLASDEEAAFLSSRFIKTFTSRCHPDVWGEAVKDRTSWILKEALLGKGEGIVIGKDTDPEEWRRSLTGSGRDTRILQPFLTQTKFDFPRGGRLQQHVVGSFFGISDCFMGTNLVRCSADKIINFSSGSGDFAVSVVVDKEKIPADGACWL